MCTQEDQEKVAAVPPEPWPLRPDISSIFGLGGGHHAPNLCLEEWWHQSRTISPTPSAAGAPMLMLRVYPEVCSLRHPWLTSAGWIRLTSSTPTNDPPTSVGAAENVEELFWIHKPWRPRRVSMAHSFLWRRSRWGTTWSGSHLWIIHQRRSRLPCMGKINIAFIGFESGT